MPTSKKTKQTKARLLSNKIEGEKNASSSGRKKSTQEETKKTTRSTIISALLTRLLFLIHTAVAIWRVSHYYPQDTLYFLAIGVGFLLVETVLTIGVRHGKEYKWFCPSFFFYLLSVVPCLWLLEVNLLNVYSGVPINQGGCNNTAMTTISLINETFLNESDIERKSSTQNSFTDVLQSNNDLNKSREKRDLVFDPANNMNRTEVMATTDYITQPSNFKFYTTESLTLLSNDYFPTSRKMQDENSTKVRATSSGEQTISESVSTMLVKEVETKLTAIKQISQNIVNELEGIAPETWLLSLHQVLLFVLVIGRWLLPKGTISRDQLSQLLLVFIGVGADILEFVVETIDHDTPSVRCQIFLHYLIYGVWSWSLIQFTLVLTASKSRKTRLGFSSDNSAAIVKNKKNCCTNSMFNDADVWGIVVTLMLQDVPFLAFRLFIMIKYEQVHQMMVFFTGKNFLVVCLQIYRLVVLKLEKKPKKNDVEKVSQSELEPLRDTLKRLASESKDGEDFSNSTIERASFKKTNDGNITVKLRIIDE